MFKIKNVGCGPSEIVLLHDNDLTLARTVKMLEKFRCDIFDRPPYSPDLAPSDCHLFLHLKKWLASQLFE